MKTKFLLFLSFMTLAVACRKDNQTPEPMDNNNSQIQTLALKDVQNWYDHQSSLQTSATQNTFNLPKLSLDWSKAASIQAKKSNYWLMLLSGQLTLNKAKSGYRKIAFLKDSLGNIQARILEIIPDVKYWLLKGKVSTADFTGRVFIYDQGYHFLSGKIYAGGKQTGKIRPATATTVNSAQLKTNQIYVGEDCEWSDSHYIDGNGELVIYSERICDYDVYDDGFYPDESNYGGGSGGIGGDALGGGGGGGSPSPAPPDPTLPPAVEELPGENNPGINPKDFIKCFDTLPDDGSIMQVTVYVQEPQPGTAFPIGANGVGHTAIGLSKTYAGVTINQTVGFYPQDHSQILNGPSKMVDNSNTDFNSSITYIVNSAQFNQIAAYIANPPGTYDIYNFNCTNFAIAAMQQVGIVLPNSDTIVGLNGVGGFAHSMTPGGLGDSLDSMKGQSNVNSKGGLMPVSHGACN